VSYGVVLLGDLYDPLKVIRSLSTVVVKDKKKHYLEQLSNKTTPDLKQVLGVYLLSFTLT